MMTNFEKLFREFFLVLFSIILFFLLPLFLFLSSPVFTIRICVKYIVEALTTNKMLSAASSLFAQHDSMQSPKCTIISMATYKESISYKEFLDTYEKRVLNCKLRNGKLRYPELQMHLESRLGFKFWKPVENFDIKNHIKEIKGFKAEDDVKKIAEALITKLYEDGISPWEVIWIPNVLPKNSFKATTEEECKSVFIYRFHHSLADGYSSFKMLLRLNDYELPKMENANSRPKNYLRDYCLLPFKFFYTLAECLAMLPKKDPWKILDSSKVGIYSIDSSDELRCSVFKEIKSGYDIAFTSIVYAALAGAIRKISLKKGMKIPETMSCQLPIPKPGHPDKLCNHYVTTALDLPVGEPDPVRRLYICQKNYESLKTSARPIVSDVLIQLTGSYFNWMAKAFRNNFCGVVISYLPFRLGNTKISLNGREMTELEFFMGILPGSSGATISMMNINDIIHSKILAHPSVLSEADCEEFLKMLEDEVNLPNTTLQHPKKYK